jgi:calcium/calmodulin-dependent 3',5'-cyclic nucleotide phosphodiesterase
VFAVNEAADNHSLKFVRYELLQKYDLIAKYKISSNVLDVFLLNLEQGYSKYKNPYHNLLHGADVAQSVHVILTQSKKCLRFRQFIKNLMTRFVNKKNVFISGNSLKIK